MDLTPPPPATYGQPWAICRKPPLNGGGPKKPDPPPAAPAPPRADTLDGTMDASRLAARKKGLRRTMLEEMAGIKAPMLGSTTALGSYVQNQ